MVGGCSFDSTFFPIDERPDKLTFASSEKIILQAPDGKSISHFFVKPASDAKATILVFHGSGSKVSNWLQLLAPLVDNDFQVFLMEYRGFGDSEGEAGHEAVAADARRALLYLVERQDVKNKKILVLGQSYGGQLAINVAAEFPAQIDALITEGAFSSFKDIATYSTPWIVRPFTAIFFSNSYSAAKLIERVSTPTLVIHSRDDSVVPFHMGEELYRHAGGRKEFWAISGRHADALIDYPNEFVRKLDKFIELKDVQ